MKTNEELRSIKEGSQEFNSLSIEEQSEWYSLQIFNKSSKDIKYLLTTCYVHDQLLQENLARTGLYQWVNVFRGDVKYPRDVVNYNDYDLIQVNMSTQDIHLVGDIRDVIGKDSKTKLVLNNDYTTEMWGNAFDWPSTITREIRNADMLFGTEYFQASALSELSGRTVHVIPHPADVKRMKSLAPLKKKNIISTIWRRYDNFYYIPHLVTRNHGLTTQLIGYDKNMDRKTFVATTLYDTVLAATNVFQFMDQMRTSLIVYDPFTFHSYSRSTVDTAALGVAVVGSNRTQSMQICYPHTCVDPYDVIRGRELIDKLIHDKDFYDLVVKTALENVEFYNHVNSRHRYLKALYESIKLGRDEKQITVQKLPIERTTGDDILQTPAYELNKKQV